ncbi:hypothetical protein M0R45_018864 [Rubus argutus]|uniref:Uncharacterized protein n=1 Tax=Rubus argutus TaxID=59490 RepID=A0AAW1X783_RUBAR
MKRKRSSNLECVALLDPSIANCLSCFPYVWDNRNLEVKKSKGNMKMKTFRRLKDMYQKILWDILDCMVSRLKNGQTVGFLTLQTIKIKDNVAYLPEVSALAMGNLKFSTLQFLPLLNGLILLCSTASAQWSTLQLLPLARCL